MREKLVEICVAGSISLCYIAKENGVVSIDFFNSMALSGVMILSILLWKMIFFVDEVENYVDEE